MVINKEAEEAGEAGEAGAEFTLNVVDRWRYVIITSPFFKFKFDESELHHHFNLFHA